MPKTKEQFEQIRNERIADILKASLPLFAIKGYEGVNLDEVTKKANCSHGLLYHYFKDKEELYEAVLNNIVFPYGREVYNQIDLNQKAKYVFQDLLEAFIKDLKSPNDEKAMIIYILLNIHLQKNLRFIKKDEGGHTMIYSYVSHFIEQGQQEGDFNDISSLELTICIISILKGVTFNRLHVGSKKFVCPKSSTIMKILLK